MQKKLFGDTVIYGLSSIVGRTLNYLLVPLYTSIFMPGEYGIVTELYVYTAFFNVFFIYGMETAFFRFASKAGPSSKVFHISQTLIFISTTVFGLILTLSTPWISAALEYEKEINLFYWVILIICFDAIVALPFAKLRLEGKSWRFAAYKLSNITINMALNLFFLVVCPYLVDNFEAWDTWLSGVYDPEIGVGYVFLSNLIANALYLVFFTGTWFKFRFVWDTVTSRKMLAYALPISVLGLAGVTNEMLSRSMLRFRLPDNYYEGLGNLDALGIFGAVYKLSIFMTLVVQAFKYAYEPFFFNKSGSANSRLINAEVMNYFIIFICLGWLGLVVVLPDIAPIFLRQALYLQGLQAVPLLLGAGALLGILYNLSVWYKLTDNNWYGALISVLGALVTIIGNFWLIPFFGYMGSAWTSFFAFLIMVIISFILGQKFYPIPYRVGNALIYFSICTMSVMVLNFAELSILFRYLLGLTFVVLFVFVVVKMEKPKGLSTFVRQKIR